VGSDRVQGEIPAPNDRAVGGITIAK
jgi:hypothetical protein